MDVDEGGVRLVMLGSMGAMFGVALAVPGAFGDEAVLLGVAYPFVRLIHLLLSGIVARDDPDRLGALLRFARRRSSALRCSSWPASSTETAASSCGWWR
jgi:hypothetical protein